MYQTTTKHNKAWRVCIYPGPNISHWLTALGKGQADLKKKNHLNCIWSVVKNVKHCKSLRMFLYMQTWIHVMCCTKVREMVFIEVNNSLWGITLWGTWFVHYSHQQVMCVVFMQTRNTSRLTTGSTCKYFSSYLPGVNFCISQVLTLLVL